MHLVFHATKRGRFKLCQLLVRMRLFSRGLLCCHFLDEHVDGSARPSFKHLRLISQRFPWLVLEFIQVQVCVPWQGRRSVFRSRCRCIRGTHRTVGRAETEIKGALPRAEQASRDGVGGRWAAFTFTEGNFCGHCGVTNRFAQMDSLPHKRSDSPHQSAPKSERR